ncbi:polysaccharide lyase [Asticcacaulis solisilvae]|uniref:polysaccharide lyase n=1 Tax=Asticcacaulis solisilvae TaxID=1217274 RepID=UPI003FD7011F
MARWLKILAGTGLAGAIAVGALWFQARGEGVFAHHHLFHADFDGDADGPYGRAAVAHDFSPPWADGIDEGRADIVSSPCGKALRVRYPAGAVGKGVIIPVRLPVHQALYLAYDVYVPVGFDFVKEGKLSGLCGGTCNSGGNRPTGRDGWSSRVIWRAGGQLAQYVYAPGQAGPYGDILYWKDAVLTAGRWHHIETYVQVNRPGQADGVIRSWFDGRMAFSDDHVRLRDTDAFAIDTFKFETFFGGGAPDFAPGEAQFLLFDNITVDDRQGPAGACSQ